MDIQCSRCGATMSFAYSAGHVIGATRAGWNSYGSALYCPACSETWDERNKGRPLAGPENTIDVIDSMYARECGYDIDRDKELAYMAQFAVQSFFGEELYRDQFRALWTAYCFHHGLDVDTSSYDDDLAQLWDIVSEVGEDTSDWSDLDSFGQFMCRYLV